MTKATDLDNDRSIPGSEKGKSAFAPCGHDGVYITRNYIQCTKGCDSVAKKKDPPKKGLAAIDDLVVDQDDGDAQLSFTATRSPAVCVHYATMTMSGVTTCITCKAIL